MGACLGSGRRVVRFLISHEIVSLAQQKTAGSLPPSPSSLLSSIAVARLRHPLHSRCARTLDRLFHWNELTGFGVSSARCCFAATCHKSYLPGLATQASGTYDGVVRLPLQRHCSSTATSIPQPKQTKARPNRFDACLFIAHARQRSKFIKEFCP